MEIKYTPEVIEKFDKITDKFLCPLSANVYNIQFVYFKIRDLDSKCTLFEVENP